MEKIQLFPVCKELMVKGKDGKHEVGRKERTDMFLKEMFSDFCLKGKFADHS